MSEAPEEQPPGQQPAAASSTNNRGEATEAAPAKRPGDDEVEFISSKPVKKRKLSGELTTQAAEMAQEPMAPPPRPHQQVPIATQQATAGTQSLPAERCRSFCGAIPTPEPGLVPLFESRGASLPVLDNFVFPVSFPSLSAQQHRVSEAISPRQLPQALPAPVGAPADPSQAKPLPSTSGPASQHSVTLDQISCLDFNGVPTNTPGFDVGRIFSAENGLMSAAGFADLTPAIQPPPISACAGQNAIPFAMYSTGSFVPMMPTQSSGQVPVSFSHLPMQQSQAQVQSLPQNNPQNRPLNQPQIQPQFQAKPQSQVQSQAQHQCQSLGQYQSPAQVQPHFLHQHQSRYYQPALNVPVFGSPANSHANVSTRPPNPQGQPPGGNTALSRASPPAPGPAPESKPKPHCLHCARMRQHRLAHQAQGPTQPQGPATTTSPLRPQRHAPHQSPLTPTPAIPSTAATHRLQHRPPPIEQPTPASPRPTPVLPRSKPTPAPPMPTPTQSVPIPLGPSTSASASASASARGNQLSSPNQLLMQDIAQTIQSTFPYAQVAARHGVLPARVVEVLTGVVVGPLLRGGGVAGMG